MLPHHDRYDCLPIVVRPDYSWPGGKRLAVYIALNIEHFAYAKGLGHIPVATRPDPPPDNRSYAWREYGMRVGIWRLFDILDQHELPCAHLTNSIVGELYPDVVAKVRSRAGGGRIVNVGSQRAKVAKPNMALYGLSKAGLVYLTKAMADRTRRTRDPRQCRKSRPVRDPIHHRPLCQAAGAAPGLPGRRAPGTPRHPVRSRRAHPLPGCLGGHLHPGAEPAGRRRQLTALTALVIGGVARSLGAPFGVMTFANGG